FSDFEVIRMLRCQVRGFCIFVLLVMSALVLSACVQQETASRSTADTAQGTAADQPPSTQGGTASNQGTWGSEPTPAASGGDPTFEPQSDDAVPGEARSDEELIAALNPHVVTAHNRLGMLIFGQLVSQTRPAGGADAETDDESVFISPISIALALGMAYNGAAGETETAMAKALQLEGLLQEGLLQEALLQEGPRQEGLLQDSTTTASPDADGTRLTRTDINASNLALLEALTGTGAR